MQSAPGRVDLACLWSSLVGARRLASGVSICCGVLLSCRVDCAVGADSARPNIVIIIADDQGWGDLSIHGNANVRTPRIDALAQGGARFDRFFVSPVCAPTRASLLTGRYSLRTGVRGVSRGEERLNLDEVTLAEILKSAGYATGAFGKWHNGTQYPYHPNGRGFDEFYGFTSGHWGQYFDPELDHNGRKVRAQGYVSDLFTDNALEFIDAHRGQPFLCWLAFNTPHTPFQVPDEYFNRVEGRGLTMRGRDPENENPRETVAALAMCENMDHNVGRVLDRLEALGLAENTIAMYLSDNGPNTWRWNGDMKGRKGSSDEGGVRSPFFVRWPGQIRPGTQIDQIAADIDIFPTLIELAKIDLSRVPRAPKPFDGRSLRPLLFSAKEDWPERTLFSAYAEGKSARTQQYRADANGLYDMLADPSQRKNLAADKPQLHRQLANALQEWHAEVASRAEERPFPVGHKGFPITELPARDGVPHGNIERSAPAPNSSFFTNWTSADDRITWDIEVATAGRYEAIVYYTCGVDAVGSMIEMTFRNARAGATITEAHNPPLVGAADDRVPRKGESYVKDFKPLSLGTVSLSAGRDPLSLRAAQLLGKGIEVSSVSLILAE